LDALPERNGMAFVIVQHLDPSHDSLLVDLLAARTSMKVVQSTDGMEIERERVCVIPPGVYLAVDEKGILRLSRPLERHGARLPFDFLLNSLAKTFGSRVVCVIMSGTGADGSLGLKAIKAKGGLVVAQDLGEADYDGMPRSAIATGAVDLVLAAVKIAAALVERERAETLSPAQTRLKSFAFANVPPTIARAVGRIDRLGVADEKEAALAQREMEDRNDLGLRFGQKIDEQISARNEVEARKRRVREDVLNREHHARA
jgi:hypothetical protein